jgi:hypothetical protein
VQTPRYMTFWKKYRLHLHGWLTPF